MILCADGLFRLRMYSMEGNMDAAVDSIVVSLGALRVGALLRGRKGIALVAVLYTCTTFPVHQLID